MASNIEKIIDYPSYVKIDKSFVINNDDDGYRKAVAIKKKEQENVDLKLKVDRIENELKILSTLVKDTFFSRGWRI